MRKDVLLYLRHIADECLYLLAISQDLKKETFLADETLKRACVRSLEIIGEATKQIPVDKKLQWNEIEWKAIAGMRDRLIHDYLGVNYNIVWDVMQNKIPTLAKQLAIVIHQEEKPG